MDSRSGFMPVERFEPSTLAGLVFETSAYTVPPHRLVDDDAYDSLFVPRSQAFRCEARAFYFTRFPARACQAAIVMLLEDRHKNAAFVMQHCSPLTNPSMPESLHCDLDPLLGSRRREI